MMRILIVEDEEHLARLLAEVLGREGHAAETATDGRTALARALVEPFDLLVVDWMLPDFDGVQVVKRLRAADVRVPVLMLTARAQIEDRVEGLDAGADDYLPKPFAFPELLARVRALAQATRKRDGGDGPDSRRRHAGSGAPRGPALRRTHRPYGQGVRPARHPDAATGAGLHPVGAA
jgi:DNA-binding response OmpR family regulator